MEIHFDPAILPDVDTIAKLVSEYYTEEGLGYDGHFARRALQELLCDNRLGRVWLFRDDQEAIGYLILTYGFVVEFHGRVGVIDEVYLRRRYRQHGQFKKTLDIVEGCCRKEGIRSLRLEVEKKNAGAQQVYVKSGFVEHDRLLMTKRLD